MPSHRDPRSYVRQVSLPIPSQKGLKIQARGETVYNPTLPPRESVRTENYKRRVMQMTHQGFRSPPHKPYQGIGDPFYLDQKKLILHALGQWDETHALELSSSSDSSDDEQIPGENQQKQKPMTPANFVLRRTRKDLNTLPKELASGREMIRNVKLGHGLFQLLRKERRMKSDAKQKELRRKQEQRRNEWQPPKYDSSSDGETDDEIMEDVDLKNFMVPCTPFESEATRETSKPGTPVGLSGPVGGRNVGFQDTGSEHQISASVQASARSVRSSSRPGGSRKRQPAPRPYTPQHCNISADFNAQPDKESLFRQLCALYWILEAMNVEPPKVMGPITMSWNLKEIGGNKVTLEKVQSEKHNETKWKQFVSNQTPKAEERRGTLHRKAMTPFGVLIPPPSPTHTLLSPDMPLSTSVQHSDSQFDQWRAASTRKKSSLVPPRLGGLPVLPNFQPPTGKRYSSGRMSVSVRSARRSSTHQRGSVSSLAHSPSGSQSQLSASLGGQGPRLENVRPEGSTLSTQDSSGQLTHDEEEPDAPKNMFRFLDDYHYRDSEHVDVMHSQILEEQISAGPDASSSKSENSGTPLTALKKRRDKKFPETEYEVTAGRLAQSAPPKMNQTEFEYMKQQILESISRSEEDPRMHKLSNPAEKRSGLDFRAEYNVRPKSTPAVLHYQSQLPSNMKGVMLSGMRQRFSEVSEEKALLLHDILEAVERERMRKVQNKFSNMPTKGSLHRAIDEMRSKSVVDDDSKDKRRRTSIHQQWYIDLYNAIPDDMREDWSFNRILDKLAKYGLVEASKQSAYKFLKVLSGLRDWEVCSPDIVAATEFCREKIVEMSVEEYEEWFQQQFPTVNRPKTAPVASKSERKNEAEAGGGVNSVTTTREKLR